MNNMYIVPNQKRTENEPCASEGQVVPVSCKTSSLLLIVKSSKCLVGDTGKNNLRKTEKIHCRLRNWYFVMVKHFVMIKH